MMKAMRMAAIGVGLLFLLASCDILFMGVFPSSLGQATSRSDLSRTIGAAEAATFNLAIARAYGFELVILYSTAGFDATKDHMIVLSPKLEVMNKYTLADIPFFSGSSVFAHLVNGHIEVGNFDGVASSAGLTSSGSPQLPVQLTNWPIIGATMPTMNAYTWNSFRIDSTNTLFYDGYTDVWTGPTPLSRLVRPLDSAHGPLSLDGVFTNPEDDLGNVSLFVFRESGANIDYFIQMPKSPDVDVPPATPIFASGYPTFSKENLEYGSISVTEDSIVAFDHDTGSWNRFTPSDPDTVRSLHVGRRSSNEKAAFSFSGGYYCVWDPDTRVLTRYEDWW